jgi:hypothetical protein
VDVGDFQAGLGRLNFATQALIYERPFLGILYGWISTIYRAGLRRATLPWAVAFVLGWLGTAITERRLMKAPRPPKGPPLDWFRADAKATDTQAWIGGWELPGGTEVTKEARWFALEIDRQSFPWAFSKGSPKRTIAALELLATLMCIKLFGNSLGDRRPRSCTLTASTDNAGNTFIVSKMLTTKYPSILVLMELVEELRLSELQLDLSWRNRDLNEEADDLTNSNFGRFDMEKRIQVDASKLEWKILPLLDKEAQRLYESLKKIKEGSTLSSKNRMATERFQKRPAKEKLRQRDPW